MKKLRVLLKISGEALSGQGRRGFSQKALCFLSDEIFSIAYNFELAIVLGGGNLIRGGQLSEELAFKDKIVADYAGMLSVVINGLILREVLEDRHDLKIDMMSALETGPLVKKFSRREAKSSIEAGNILIFVGGTGSPGFSSDMSMVLRAHEINADIILKGTKVGGVFSEDPAKNKAAQFFPFITFKEFLEKQLSVVDPTAISYARGHDLAIRVFNIFERGNLQKAVNGEVGSLIH